MPRDFWTHGVKWIGLGLALALGVTWLAAHRTGRLVGQRSGESVPRKPPEQPASIAAPDPTSSSAQSAFQDLTPLRICNLNTRDCLDARLYDRAGKLNEPEAKKLDQLLGDFRDPKQPETWTLDRRLFQLIFKTAYFFQSGTVEVVSAYRKARRKREGFHAQGLAMDFKLTGVPAASLASYLRELPRVGVGVYTHPRTQYVHLDVRQRSYHWLDASPPNRTWREKSLGGPDLAARDESYTPEDDWPLPATPVQREMSPLLQTQ